MTRRDLAQILHGGYCTRWHANPDMAQHRETLAEHHGRVVQILLALHPAPSVALLDAAAHHDAGEPLVGDLPQPFKVRHPELAEAHARAEGCALTGLGIDLEPAALADPWLRLADRLAAWMHVAQVAPHLLRRPDWQDAGRETLDLASELGAGAPVQALLEWGIR